jgi:hypothetical protein
MIGYAGIDMSLRGALRPCSGQALATKQSRRWDCFASYQSLAMTPVLLFILLDTDEEIT